MSGYVRRMGFAAGIVFVTIGLLLAGVSIATDAGCCGLAIGALIAAATDKETHPVVREAAAWSFERMPLSDKQRDRVVTALIGVVSDPDEPDPRKWPEVPYLVRFSFPMSTTNPCIRRVAAETLGYLVWLKPFAEAELG